MEVHYDEGIAIDIGPEPCAGLREGVGEASAGEYIGGAILGLLPGQKVMAGIARELLTGAAGKSGSNCSRMDI